MLCFYFVFLRLVYPMLPVSLDCPFLIIAHSVFSIFTLPITIYSQLYLYVQDVRVTDVCALFTSNTLTTDSIQSIDRPLTIDRSTIISRHSCFLQQHTLPPRYYGNMVVIGVKHINARLLYMIFLQHMNTKTAQFMFE